MNARTDAVGGFGFALRQVPGVLHRCVRPGMKLAALAAVLLFGGLCVLVLAKSDKPQRELAALLMAGMASFTLWGLWLARLLPLQLHARLMRLPVLERSLRLALALAAMLTLLLPALLLGMAGVPPWLALGVVVASACLAVLVGMLPPIGWLCLLPLPLLLKYIGAWLPALGTASAMAAFAAMTPLLLPLTVWRWSALLRGAELPSRHDWLQPQLLSSGRAHAGMMDLVSPSANAQLPDWMWPAGQVGNAGPQRPARAMRALLGTPFAPLSKRQWLIQLALMLVFMLLAVGWVGIDANLQSVVGRVIKGGQIGGIIGGVMGGAGTLLLMYGQRLVEVYRKPGAELNELALLPGFGDAVAQRASLMRALTQALGGVMLVLLLLLGISTLLAGWPWPRWSLLLATALSVPLLTWLICLRQLAGLPVWGWRMQLLLWPLLLLIGSSWTYVLIGKFMAGALPWLAWSWLLLVVFGCLLLASAWQKFQARPHPFLQG